MKRPLNLKIFNKNDSHSDLALLINYGETEILADTYYFLLDYNDSVNSVTSIKVTQVKKLLKIWKDKLDNINIGESCYLPFDFSDQYIGCIKFNMKENEVLEYTYGFTQKVTGLDMYPSYSMEFELENNDFKIDSKVFSEQKSLIIESINYLIENLDIEKS